MSFSVSENLRRFLRKLVSGGQYKNNSIVMREALTRMMNSYDDVGDIAINTTESDITISTNTITGNVMLIVDKYNEFVEKKINKLEIAYSDAIKGKNCFYYKEDKTIVYVVEDSVEGFQLFIAQLNQIEELKNIRYVIL